jgi:hypothetical protein
MAANLSARPLRDTRSDSALFTGREVETDSVLRGVEAGYNALVLGEPGAGKTSWLHHVRGRLRGDGWETALVSGRLASDARELLGLVLHQLGPASGDAPAGTSAGGGRTPVAPREPPPAEGEGEALLDLLDGIREATAGRPPAVVLVDELPSPAVAHTLFGRLRDEVWALPLRWVVTADRSERPLYLRPPTDAFFEVVVELDPLNLETTSDLLRRRLAADVDPALVEAIARAGDGNPRRTIALAREVLVHGRPLDAARAAEEERDERLSGLSAPARRLVAELRANGPASASDEGILRRLGWTRGRTSQVLGELEAEHLVRSTASSAGHGRPRKVYELVDE